MIRVTIWNEYRQEKETGEYADQIRAVHPNGIHNTLKEVLGVHDEFQIRTATMDMPSNGLTDEVLNETDVLLWWAHVAHDDVADAIADKVHQHILKGMGFIALHSAHVAKPLIKAVGSSMTLKWRHDDFCRVWTTAPYHPIAEGIPEYFELENEELYSEPFDIAKPDEVVFTSWYRSGHIFRGGLTWQRGYGKVFYFHPGHETDTAYRNEYVQRILYNAIRWAAPTLRREALDCPHVDVLPEA